MVFGWGKKKSKQVPESIPNSKEIQLSDVEKITSDLRNLRQSQTLEQIVLIRKHTLPLIQELAKIGENLEKDDLKVEDIDKNIRIIVVRGKKQVIDVIKKDSGELPKISSFDDVIIMNNNLNQKLKRIGDVLGRQTRVIHIFAKKYAGKLKEILAQMNTNHSEIQTLIKNFEETKTNSLEISDMLKAIKNFSENIILQKQKITEFETSLKSTEKKINEHKDQIEKIKSNEKYSEFLELKQKLSSLDELKNKTKHNIDGQFSKISRPLSRYEYVSSLDKEQKSLLSLLVNNPFSALTPKNKDSILVILENVQKGILAGSISVKDATKSVSNVLEIKEKIDEFIKNSTNLEEKKQELQNRLSDFDTSDLTNQQKALDKANFQKQDFEKKISSYKSEIVENQERIPKIISEIEYKLKQFSNTDYQIIRPKQN